MSQTEYRPPQEVPRNYVKWGLGDIFKLYCYFGTLLLVVLNLPNQLWDPTTQTFTLLIGILGIWRYSWWFVHVVRAKYYEHVKFPTIRHRAREVWDGGWRPRHVHFMMTTYMEHRPVTEAVINSIVREVRDTGCRATIWLGSSVRYDEDLIADYLKLIAGDLPIDFIVVRQNVSGKRVAITLVLRAMCRRNIDKNDLICFMDGDSIIGPGVLASCLPLFQIKPDLKALTTDEEVICYGPLWIQQWLRMRFAQRRIAMQSHAVSDKVLTLTGRFSVFRAGPLMTHEFVRILEADYLNHWLWGGFRFLSGDDKSTWYYMLLHDAKMLYVPEAVVYTVEYIEGRGLNRMYENFRRWSGNMLRNGSRAMALGPRKIGFFIWWCVLDQRIAMWTMLVSPVVAILGVIVKGWVYLVTYIVWILFSRMMLCLFLYQYAPRIHMSFPFILYFNQLFNAMIKVFILFRLSQQRWSNRGNQEAGFNFSWLATGRKAMAAYLTTFYITLLFLGTILYTGIIELPSPLVVAKLFGWNF